MRTLLERDGHDVFMLMEGSHAHGLTSGAVLDLVMMDLDLILPDGRESKEILCDLRQIHPKAKVIAFTGSNSFALEREIRTHGVISYMTKPLDILSLKAIIDHIVRKADCPCEPK